VQQKPAPVISKLAVKDFSRVDSMFLSGSSA